MFDLSIENKQRFWFFGAGSERSIFVRICIRSAIDLCFLQKREDGMNLKDHESFWLFSIVSERNVNV